MMFEAFLHSGLIFASNTAYVEQALQTRQLIDSLDTLLLYHAKPRDTVQLCKETDIVRVFLQFIQAQQEGRRAYRIEVTASTLVRIRYGELLGGSMKAVDALLLRDEVCEVLLRVEEHPSGLLLRLFTDGREESGALAWIEILG